MKDMNSQMIQGQFIVPIVVGILLKISANSSSKIYSPYSSKENIAVFNTSLKFILNYFNMNTPALKVGNLNYSRINHNNSNNKSHITLNQHFAATSSSGSSSVSCDVFGSSNIYDSSQLVSSNNVQP